MANSSEFKNVLESELKIVTAELGRIAVNNTKSNDWVAVPVGDDLKTADPNDEADAIEEWNERRAAMNQLETRYRNIVRALEKIDEGLYGVCEISGQEIEIERLRANPAARTNLANLEKESELLI